MAQTIKMQRNGLFADVHPDEVENYRAGGFELVAAEKSAPAPAPAKPAPKRKRKG